MAECEVCGRTLRTGRKYCFEHRNTTSGGYGGGLAQAYRLKRKNEEYIDSKLGLWKYRFNDENIWPTVIPFMIAAFVIGPTLAIIGCGIYLIYSLIAFFKSLPYKRQIKNGDEEYVDWMQGRSRDVKSDKVTSYLGITLGVIAISFIIYVLFNLFATSSFLGWLVIGAVLTALFLYFDTH